MFFRALVVFTILYSHSQHLFSHITAFLSKTPIAFRDQRDIPATMCKVSAREEHKQENEAYHTRATCVHPTINKQPSMHCLLNAFVTTNHFRPVHVCISAHLLRLTFDSLNADEKTFIQMRVQSYGITSLIMQIQITHIALHECVKSY